MAQAQARWDESERGGRWSLVRERERKRRHVERERLERHSKVNECLSRMHQVVEAANNSKETSSARELGFLMLDLMVTGRAQGARGDGRVPNPDADRERPGPLQAPSRHPPGSTTNSGPRGRRLGHLRALNSA
jgi:hypothetical protein